MSVERSAEIESVVRRMFSFFGHWDPDAFDDWYSRNDALRYIGSDGREWWSGHEEVCRLLRAQIVEFDALGLGEVEIDDLEGFVHGDTAWTAARFRWNYADGSLAMAMRFTSVLVLERGIWRIAQIHWSTPEANEESAFGTLTTSLEELADAVSSHRPDMREVATPDGTVSIVFTDIEGSTAIAEAIGDPAWVKLLARHNQLVADISHRHRGQVVKSLGDGSMVVFPSATDAIRGAMELQATVAAGPDRDVLSIRAGVHAGDAIRNADDFFGHAVTVAARVTALAAGGEILATHVVVELARGRPFRWSPSRIVTLKGITEPMEIFSLAGATSPT